MKSIDVCKQQRLRVAVGLFALPVALAVAAAPAFAADVEQGRFADTPATAWYVEGGYVDYVIDNGLMTSVTEENGMSSNSFAPDATLTRSQVALILYRWANPDKTVDTPDSLVASGAYYSDALRWCYGQEIITGYRDAETQELTGSLGSDDPVTREQFATMLYRFATGVAGMDGTFTAGGDYDAISDSDMVSEFADDAMRWCFANGIITGSETEDGVRLNPGDTVTRAQAAKMVTVLSQLMEEQGTVSEGETADDDISAGFVESFKSMFAATLGAGKR